RVLRPLVDGPAASAADLARRAACGTGVLRALLGLELVAAVELPSRPPLAVPDWRRPGRAAARPAVGVAGRAPPGIAAVLGARDGGRGSGGKSNTGRVRRHPAR